MSRRRNRRMLPTAAVAEGHASAAHSQIARAFGYQRLDKEIEAKLAEAKETIGHFNQIPGVKRTSKSLLRHPIKSKLVGGGYEGWTIFHPLRWLGKVFLRQAGNFNKKTGKWEQPGLLVSRKERARRAKAAALRQEIGIERRMQQACQRYENKLRAAASRLEGKLTEPDMALQDAFYSKAELFDSPAEEARSAFRGEIAAILKEFRAEAIKRGVIKKSKFA